MSDALESVDGALLPDEGVHLDAGEVRSWHALSSALSDQGIAVAPETSKALPYVTEFDPDLQAVLSSVLGEA